MPDSVSIWWQDDPKSAIKSVLHSKENFRGISQAFPHVTNTPISKSTSSVGSNVKEQPSLGSNFAGVRPEAQRDHSSDDGFIHSSLPNPQQFHENTGDEAQISEPTYAFQNDLDIELPDSILQQSSSSLPLHYVPNKPKGYAYATFMATRNPSLRDPYFLAIQSLIYRLLWSPHSRTKKGYPFIVFVADFVTQEQRALLSGAGALVRVLKPLEWHCESAGAQARWKDLFAKLNMWAEIEFERILFLDADAFPLSNIDAMFEIAPVKHCVEHKLDIDDFLPDRTPICEPYVFAGVPQDPLNPKHIGVNVGSMLFTPSLRMHQRLVQNYLKTDHYDCTMAEQAFLNWQFSPEGAYPPTELERQWGGFFPRKDEEGTLKVVHDKIWAIGEEWLRREWEKEWKEMLIWYKSEEFLETRTNGEMQTERN
jgi:inositol 3-alpha-galactosyltransferase